MLSQGPESFSATKYPAGVLATVTAAHVPAKNRIHDCPQDFPTGPLWILAEEDFIKNLPTHLSLCPFPVKTLESSTH